MPYRDDPFAKPVEVTTIKVKLPWYRFGRPYKDRLVQHVKVVSEWGSRDRFSGACISYGTYTPIRNRFSYNRKSSIVESGRLHTTMDIPISTN